MATSNAMSTASQALVSDWRLPSHRGAGLGSSEPVMPCPRLQPACREISNPMPEMATISAHWVVAAQPQAATAEAHQAQSPPAVPAARRPQWLLPPVAPAGPA